MTFRLHNAWQAAPACFDFTTLPSELHFAEGILPFPVCLDPEVGTETVLLLMDRTDFIHQIAATQPFELKMKAGAVATPEGPVMFLLFWVPNPQNPAEPVVALDCHVNPLDPKSVQPWRDLARQSHWHLFLIDANQEQQGFFEFENVYGLGETLDQVQTACADMAPGHFPSAKQAFCQRYDIPTLLRM